ARGLSADHGSVEVAGAVERHEPGAGQDQQCNRQGQVDARPVHQALAETQRARAQAGDGRVHCAAFACAAGAAVPAITVGGGNDDAGWPASHASRILRAIGAASVPPQAPASSTTATAMRGESAGVKQMNQARCLAARNALSLVVMYSSPLREKRSAVPVLPAITYGKPLRMPAV